jgi:hypothetical protein
MTRKNQAVSQTMRRKRNKKKGARSIMMHLFARIAGQNILPKQKISAGNLRRARTHAQTSGNQRKAPEGAWGP